MALLGLSVGTPNEKSWSKLNRGALQRFLDKDHQMAGSNLARHIVDRFEKRWAQKLEVQARNWQSVRPDGRTSTDRGVPVVWRRKRAKPAKAPAA